MTSLNRRPHQRTLNGHSTLNGHCNILRGEGYTTTVGIDGVLGGGGAIPSSPNPSPALAFWWFALLARVALATVLAHRRPSALLALVVLAAVLA